MRNQQLSIHKKTTNVAYATFDAVYNEKKMAHACQENIDPRIRRTRQLLQQALKGLLERKDFDSVSVQDIADAATVNRATFYDHFGDKFALLEYMVAKQFQELLKARGIRFDSDCSQAIRGVIRGVCDYLAESRGAHRESRRRLDPHMETAVIAVVRTMLLEGYKRHPAVGEISREIICTTAAWAIYGAAHEWLSKAERSSEDQIVETIARLVSPILEQAQADRLLA